MKKYYLLIGLNIFFALLLFYYLYSTSRNNSCEYKDEMIYSFLDDCCYDFNDHYDEIIDISKTDSGDYIYKEFYIDAPLIDVDKEVADEKKKNRFSSLFALNNLNEFSLSFFYNENGNIKYLPEFPTVRSLAKNNINFSNFKPMDFLKIDSYSNWQIISYFSAKLYIDSSLANIDTNEVKNINTILPLFHYQFKFPDYYSDSSLSHFCSYLGDSRSGLIYDYVKSFKIRIKIPKIPGCYKIWTNSRTNRSYLINTAPVISDNIFSINNIKRVYLTKFMEELRNKHQNIKLPIIETNPYDSNLLQNLVRKERILDSLSKSFNNKDSNLSFIFFYEAMFKKINNYYPMLFHRSGCESHKEYNLLLF